MTKTYRATIGSVKSSVIFFVLFMAPVMLVFRSSVSVIVLFGLFMFFIIAAGYLARYLASISITQEGNLVIAQGASSLFSKLIVPIEKITAIEKDYPGWPLFNVKFRFVDSKNVPQSIVYFNTRRLFRLSPKTIAGLIKDLKAINPTIAVADEIEKFANSTEKN